jgi:2-dehydropantoate 2-reductase
MFGARLTHAGHAVHFVVRAATLPILHRDGIVIESVDGDLRLPHVHATSDAASIGPVDVVLVCVKSWQIEGVAPSLAPLIGPATAVIPLQNGVEASTQLARRLGDAHVMEGLARVIAEAKSPGHIMHTAVSPMIECGPRAATPADSLARATLTRFVAAINEAGMHAVVPASVELALWEKFLFIDPFSTVGAITRVPLGVIRSTPQTRALLDACLREVMAVGAAAGVVLPEAALQRTWQRYDSLPPESMTSMQRDLMAGRPSEYEWQTGTVVRLGRLHQVPTPVHDILYAALKPIGDMSAAAAH